MLSLALHVSATNTFIVHKILIFISYICVLKHVSFVIIVGINGFSEFNAVNCPSWNNSSKFNYSADPSKFLWNQLPFVTHALNRNQMPAQTSIWTCIINSYRIWLRSCKSLNDYHLDIRGWHLFAIWFCVRYTVCQVSWTKIHRIISISMKSKTWYFRMIKCSNLQILEIFIQ